MAFVLRIHNERRRIELQADVWHKRFLRTEVGRLPIYWMCGLALSTDFHLSARPLRHYAKYCLDPRLEELVHRHLPRYAFPIAQPSQDSLLNCPFDGLQTVDEWLSPKRASGPASKCRG